MSAQAWLIIAIIGFSLAGVARIVSAFIFIRLDIPSVIGDLTGKRAAREIKALKEFNRANENRKFRENNRQISEAERVQISQEAQRAMAEAHSSKRLDKTFSQELPYGKIDTGTVGLDDFARPPAKNFSTEELAPGGTEVLREGTEVLSADTARPTEVLSSDTTEILRENPLWAAEDLNTAVAPYATEVLKNGTELLYSGGTEELSESTAVLSERTEVLSQSGEETTELTAPASFEVTRTMVITHSDEVIE